MKKKKKKIHGQKAEFVLTATTGRVRLIDPTPGQKVVISDEAMLGLIQAQYRSPANEVGGLARVEWDNGVGLVTQAMLATVGTGGNIDGEASRLDYALTSARFYKQFGVMPNSNFHSQPSMGTMPSSTDLKAYIEHLDEDRLLTGQPIEEYVTFMIVDGLEVNAISFTSDPENKEAYIRVEMPVEFRSESVSTLRSNRFTWQGIGYKHYSYYPSKTPVSLSATGDPFNFGLNQKVVFDTDGIEDKALAKSIHLPGELIVGQIVSCLRIPSNNGEFRNEYEIEDEFGEKHRLDEADMMSLLEYEGMQTFLPGQETLTTLVGTDPRLGLEVSVPSECIPEEQQDSNSVYFAPGTNLFGQITATFEGELQIDDYEGHKFTVPKDKVIFLEDPISESLDGLGDWQYRLLDEEER